MLTRDGGADFEVAAGLEILGDNIANKLHNLMNLGLWQLADASEKDGMERLLDMVEFPAPIDLDPHILG